jgi:hypothetical protein
MRSCDQFLTGMRITDLTSTYSARRRPTFTVPRFCHLDAPAFSRRVLTTSPTMAASSELQTAGFVNAAITHLVEDEINRTGSAIDFSMPLGDGIVIGDDVKLAIHVQALKYPIGERQVVSRTLTGKGKPNEQRGHRRHRTHRIETRDQIR